MYIIIRPTGYVVSMSHHEHFLFRCYPMGPLVVLLAFVCAARACHRSVTVS